MISGVFEEIKFYGGYMLGVPVVAVVTLDAVSVFY